MSELMRSPAGTANVLPEEVPSAGRSGASCKQVKGLTCNQAKSMFQGIRSSVQLFGVILAILLLGMWVYYFNILFVVGALIGAVIAGRVFCGWICPNGTWSDYVVRLFSPGRDLPTFFKNKWFGYGFTIVFLAAFVGLRFVITDATKVWMIPIGIMFVQFALATVFGALFYPRAFCAHVCPWGVLASLLGRRAKYQMMINPNCKNCRTCAQECPLGGILEPALDQVQDTNRITLLSPKCMRCMQCVNVCPSNALHFGVRPDVTVGGNKDVKIPA